MVRNVTDVQNSDLRSMGKQNKTIATTLRRMTDQDRDDCSKPVNVNGLSEQFGKGYSSSQLVGYRKSGLGQRALAVIEFLQARGLEGKSVLDIGSGIGALHMELLLAGAERATGVDASATNIAAARELAEELDLTGKVEERQGDFVELAGAIPQADIVTLDRAI